MSKVQQSNAAYALTFLTFLVLRLTGVIHWSWWWVTAPLWIWFALFAIAGVTILTLTQLAALDSDSCNFNELEDEL